MTMEARKAAKEIVVLVESVTPANWGISKEEQDQIAKIIQGAIDASNPKKKKEQKEQSE